MALPQTRQTFKEFCLRQLGQGVININVSDPQVEDCVDLALQFWQDYHFQAKTKIYSKHVITAAEIALGQIVIPPLISDVISVYMNDAGVSSGIFSLRYQLQLNDLYDLSSTNLSNYVIAQQYVNTIQNVLSPESQIRFQQYNHTISFDTNINLRFLPGQFIIIEAYAYVDPATTPEIWTNRTLINLCTAYIKRVFGSNLKKFAGMQLPGGTVMDGNAIYSEAVREISELEETFINKYQDPDYLFIA